MSGYIDTRESGWRELDVIDRDSIYQLAEYDARDGSVVRAWVREEPVPPLPTEPHHAISVTWRGEPPDPEMHHVLYCTGRHYIDREGRFATRAQIEAAITGFEVLASPSLRPAVVDGAALEQVRRETAKAVVRMLDSRWPTAAALIANEFEVES